VSDELDLPPATGRKTEERNLMSWVAWPDYLGITAAFLIVVFGVIIWGLVWTGSDTAVPLMVLRELAVWLLKAELVGALPIWVVARVVDLLTGGPSKRRGGRP
jgi:hypothetical protein